MEPLFFMESDMKKKCKKPMKGSAGSPQREQQAMAGKTLNQRRHAKQARSGR